MKKIFFQNNYYPIAVVDMPFGQRIISCHELNHALMNHDGSYVSDEAKNIDDSIFYFVETKTLYFCKPDIVKKILSEI